jgi:hypothetical protein
LSEEEWFRDVDTLFRQLYRFGYRYLVVALSPELRVADIIPAYDTGEYEGDLAIARSAARRRGKVVITLRVDTVEEVK